MNRIRTTIKRFRATWLLAALALVCGPALHAQVPVDEAGNPIHPVDSAADPVGSENASVAGEDAPPPLTGEELEELIGPIALYPDKLLAIVLPASTYPLQIVQAARFLERLEENENLEPDESWDESVTALLNYPEVVQMMDEDIDWTWRLGEAVVQQQPDVIAAIESFRDRAYAAGNLKTDRRQTVTSNEGVIEIEPVEEDIIYVPYYEPEKVVYHQPRQVYYYYPRPYPVYYYPYPAHHSFLSGYFWGVTTAFHIGWATDHLHVYHPTYWGHPYYGRHYFGHYYRRPSITIYNSWYVNGHPRRATHSHRDGDFWRPRHDGGARPGHWQARTGHFREVRRERTTEGYRQAERRSASSGTTAGFRGELDRNRAREQTADRTRRGFAASRDAEPRETGTAERQRAAGDAAGDRTIRFRSRGGTAGDNAVGSRLSREGNAGERPALRAPSAASRAAPAPRREGTAASETRRAATTPRTARPRVTAPRSTITPGTVPPRTATAPRAAEQRVAPRATAPRSTPRVTAPRSTPRVTAPRSTPRVTAPRSAPSAASPRSAPRASAPPSAPRASAPSSAPRAAAPQSAPRSNAARSTSATGSRRSSQRH